MEKVQTILNGSLFWRLITALSLWFSTQWKSSRLIHAFLNPSDLDRSVSQSSFFYRAWLQIVRFFRFLYRALRLDKLFSGSVFLQTFFWCALPAVLAPLLPTMAVLALCLVGFASLMLNFLRDTDRTLAFSPINRYVLLYGAVYLAASLFSVTRADSLKVGLLTIVFVYFCIILENAVATRRQLDRLAQLMVLAAACVALYGIYQYLFQTGYQSKAWVDSDMFSSITFRVSSTLQNPNMLGQYFILTIPLGGACLLSAKTWGKRIFWLVCCGLLALSMLLTFSRGAWLGLLFAGAAFVVLLNPRLILLAPVALAILYFVLPDAIVSRFTSIGDLTDNSTSYRLYIWFGTLAMLKDYWLCGIGPGDTAYNLVYPAYSYSGVEAPHSHNLFLQIVCDAGITALLVFLAILFHYYRQLCAALHAAKDHTSRMFQIAFLSGMTGFLVQAMTDYSFYNHRVMFLFWVYLSVGVLFAQRDKFPQGGIAK